VGEHARCSLGEKVAHGKVAREQGRIHHESYEYFFHEQEQHARERVRIEIEFYACHVSRLQTTPQRPERLKYDFMIKVEKYIVDHLMDHLYSLLNHGEAVASFKTRSRVAYRGIFRGYHKTSRFRRMIRESSTD